VENWNGFYRLPFGLYINRLPFCNWESGIILKKKWGLLCYEKDFSLVNAPDNIRNAHGLDLLLSLVFHLWRNLTIQPNPSTQNNCGDSFGAQI
jgi:hypothetical protein